MKHLENPAQRTDVGVIVGAGAQGRITAHIWRRAEPSRELFFLDDNRKLWGTLLEGTRVVGPVGVFEDRVPKHSPSIVAVGDNRTRAELGLRLSRLGIRLTNVIDPSATIITGATVAAGVFIGPQAVVHTGARIGAFSIINTAAIVEHDCVLEEGVSLAPGVHMGGRVHIEEHAFVSTGATLLARVRVGAGAIVGGGAVVTRNVPDGCLVFGCPARAIRQATDADWCRLF
jgi:sugar O-acyltransferase (sialic acid O-acetyltransferase NeuD family)